MKSTSKKTLSGTVININKRGKKTRQGEGRNSKPSHGRKLSRGQG